MTINEEIKIPLSKTKMVLAFLGACLFVALGIWLITSPSQGKNPTFGNPFSLLIAGYSVAIFFGFCAIILILKLTDKKPGMTINKEGITDNSSGLSNQFIPWSDITKIDSTTVINQKFVKIIVNNPTDYINRVKNPFKRNALEMNYKMYGTPICISANSLKTNVKDLQNLLITRFEQYNQLK